MGLVERTRHVESAAVFDIGPMALGCESSIVRVGVDLARGEHRCDRNPLESVPVISYPVLRTIHLLSGVFALPALLIYGVSAVQMAHTTWFPMKPVVTEIELPMHPGYTDGRQLAHDVMAARNLHGE